MWAPVATEATLSVIPAWGVQTVKSIPVVLPAGKSSQVVMIDADASDIKLWWPTNLGEHKMYSIKVTLSPSKKFHKIMDGPPIQGVTTERSIGFRTFALVTG